MSKTIVTDKHLLVMLGAMHSQLESSRLEVALVAAPECKHVGHKVRTVQSMNPAWYQELCSMHTSCRSKGKQRNRVLHDTKVKRNNILSVIRRLAAGLPTVSTYARDIVALAEELLEEDRQIFKGEL